MNISVSSTINSATFLQKAKDLARNLNLPFVENVAAAWTPFILVYTENGLEIQENSCRKKKNKRLLFVDFVKGKGGYRRKNDATTKQPLAKAVGIKPGFRPTVFDGTAGLGGDSFVLATLGCQVTLCERNKIIGALLHDGLTRASVHPDTKEIMGNMHFILYDSLELSGEHQKYYDTVYLDPMYPHKTTTALNKLSMRVIRDIVGDDDDSAQLIGMARQIAGKRIVVKRPRLAPPLSEDGISYQIKMKSSRYDIYLIDRKLPFNGET